MNMAYCMYNCNQVPVLVDTRKPPFECIQVGNFQHLNFVLISITNCNETPILKFPQILVFKDEKWIISAQKTQYVEHQYQYMSEMSKYKLILHFLLVVVKYFLIDSFVNLFISTYMAVIYILG